MSTQHQNIIDGYVGARYVMDGAETLAEAAQRLRGLADALESLDQPGRLDARRPG